MKGYKVFFLAALIVLMARGAVYATDKIVAVVNKDVITQKDLSDFLNFMRIQFSKDIAPNEGEERIQAMKDDLLDRLIEDKLILQEAKRLNLRVDDSRVMSKIDDMRDRYQSDKGFQEALLAQGITQADIEKKIREQLLMYTVIEAMVKSKIVINPEEVTFFYNENRARLSKPEERIFLAIEFNDESLAHSFSYEWRTTSTLEDMATRYPFTVNSFSAKKEEMRKEIDEVVFRMELGEISGPVRIDDIYYVFKVEAIVPPQIKTLSESQDQIYPILFEGKLQEKLMQWLEELKKNAYIKIDRD
ncbi:MAG: SurA N-terminal domain-containing protein [Candidatus Omnitrophica bacterium]|nr:SurA N-terminal domain-containing protein [Candidatus Omnitrophota bacterium]